MLISLRTGSCVFIFFFFFNLSSRNEGALVISLGSWTEPEIKSMTLSCSTSPHPPPKIVAEYLHIFHCPISFFVWRNENCIWRLTIKEPHGWQRFDNQAVSIEINNKCLTLPESLGASLASQCPWWHQIHSLRDTESCLVRNASLPNTVACTPVCYLTCHPQALSLMDVGHQTMECKVFSEKI